MRDGKYNVAVVGASGAVGAEMVKILEERKFPVAELIPLASERSLGQTVSFYGKDEPMRVLSSESFDGVDIALFSAGNERSRKYAPVAAGKGAVVIDNSSAFRMEKDVPLVVPEVNPEAVADYKMRGIIANPNCSTIQMVVVLNPIHKKYGIKRVVVSTYQSASGAGIEAMEELSKQTIALFSNGEIKTDVFRHRIAFNLIPHIDSFLEDGYTKEEAKLVNETKKIMKDDSILINATAVRVPVFYSHSESVNIELMRPAEINEVRRILSSAPGVTLQDDPDKNLYPMPISAAGKDDVFVGRIRADNSVPHGLSLWVVADNLRKGAALNAIQIAEILVKNYLNP
jgi:aspartate-semialdehyde dehydrogenase